MGILIPFCYLHHYFSYIHDTKIDRSEPNQLPSQAADYLRSLTASCLLSQHDFIFTLFSPAPDMESGIHEAVALDSSNIFLSHYPVTFLARKGCILSRLQQLNRVSRIPSFTFLPYLCAPFYIFPKTCFLVY